MIRKATRGDLAAIEEAYNEHFAYEREHGAFTVFQKGVYPTRKDAEKALLAGNLYVYEENGEIAGSLIAGENQPEEYQKITWSNPSARAMVIHLLMVRPSYKGRGVGSALVNYLAEQARQRACKVLRLDTGIQNVPAVSLYQKLGFRIVASATMRVGGAIEHRGHLFLEKTL